MEDKKRFLVNIAYYTVLIGLGYFAIKYLWPILLPFVCAFLVATALKRCSGYLARKLHFSKKPISIMVIALFYVILFCGLLFGGRKVLGAVRDLVVQLPVLYTTKFIPVANMISVKLQAILSDFDPELAINIENGFRQLIENIGNSLSSGSFDILKIISGYASGIPSLIVKLVLTVVSTFFIGMDYDKITAFFKRVMPDKVLNVIVKFKKLGTKMICVYLKSYSLLLCLTFMELTVGLLLLQVPHAIWIALVIAIFDILPVFGTGGILLPWAVIMVLLGNAKMAAGILLLYVIITIVRNVLEPKIVGKQMGLHPLATLIFTFTGLKLCGLAGLIGFPVALSLIVNMKREEAEEKADRNISRSMERM